MNAVTSLKFWNKNFILLMSISLCTGMTGQILNTALPLYIVNKLGSTTTISGLLGAIYVIVSSFSRPIVGKFVDKYGRKPFLLFGALLFGTSCALFGFISSVALLLFFRIIQGFGFSMCSTASSAACADNIPVKRLGEGFSYYGLAGSFPDVIGPSISLSLILWYGYSMPFVGASIACAIAAVIILFFTDNMKLQKSQLQKEDSIKGNNPIQHDPVYRGIWKYIEKTALAPAIIQITVSFSLSIYMIYMALYAQHKGFTNAGWFFALSAGAMIIVRLIGSRFTDRFSARLFLVPGYIACASAYVLIALTTSPVWFLIGGIIYGVSIGTSQPVLSVMALRSVPVNRRGAASATYMFGFDSGIGLGAVFWGMIIDLAGYTTMFFGAATLLLLSAFLSAVILRKN